MLTDHLIWQLRLTAHAASGAQAAELVIGNLNEDGYLIASDEELLGVAPPAPPESDAAAAENVVKEAAALGLAADAPSAEPETATAEEEAFGDPPLDSTWSASYPETSSLQAATGVAPAVEPPAPTETPEPAPPPQPVFRVNFTQADLHEAIEVVRQLDPPGVGCRDLRECLLYQLRFHQHQLNSHKNGNGDREATAQVLSDAIAIVDQHLRALQNKQHKEISKAINRPIEAVEQALHYIRTLDPRPGLRYNKGQARLIEPDVAFVKHGDEWLVIMNDEDVRNFG